MDAIIAVAAAGVVGHSVEDGRREDIDALTVCVAGVVGKRIIVRIINMNSIFTIVIEHVVYNGVATNLVENDTIDVAAAGVIHHCVEY